MSDLADRVRDLEQARQELDGFREKVAKTSKLLHMQVAEMHVAERAVWILEARIQEMPGGFKIIYPVATGNIKK